MRVLVCGSRDWTDGNFVSEVLTGVYEEWCVGYNVTHLDGFTVIEGGARGADTDAAWWAITSPMHSHNERPGDPPFYHEQYKADWDKHGKAAGPIRNKQMLDSGVDLVLAFSEYPITKGTSHMIGIANAAGVPVRVFSHG